MVTASLCFGTPKFLEVAVELGFDEHDAIHELLDDRILVGLKGICGRLKLEFCLPIYSCLRAGRVTGVLRAHLNDE